MATKKSKSTAKSTLKYHTGLGSYIESEAVRGALPIGRNSPQKHKLGLYPEQLTGSAFTMTRSQNLRTWVYRTQPTVKHGAFRELSKMQHLLTSPIEGVISPNQMRWAPLPAAKNKTDFVEGLKTWVANGDALAQMGCAIHQYSINASMTKNIFYSADGEMILVPQEGCLRIVTELGLIDLEPLEICVIPKGFRFQVKLLDKTARGYVCENYGAPFKLPDLGPIGANGLAAPRDFQIPRAHLDEGSGRYDLVAKMAGRLWSAPLQGAVFNVAGWHGNLYPYKYDLRRFNTIGTVSYDHPDPSIFTVLTSPSDTAGMANIDFVIFPPRWMVGEDTFRPPYFHRNIMSEFMGLIQGAYDAKADGFVPGGSSLHNTMSGHGPDAETFEKASNAQLKPHKIEDTMAFMFESRYPFVASKHALTSGLLDEKYQECWQGFKRVKV